MKDHFRPVTVLTCRRYSNHRPLQSELIKPKQFLKKDSYQQQRHQNKGSFDPFCVFMMDFQSVSVTVVTSLFSTLNMTSIILDNSTNDITITLEYNKNTVTIIVHSPNPVPSAPIL